MAGLSAPPLTFELTKINRLIRVSTDRAKGCTCEAAEVAAPEAIAVHVGRKLRSSDADGGLRKDIRGHSFSPCAEAHGTAPGSGPRHRRDYGFDAALCSDEAGRCDASRFAQRVVSGSR